MLIATTQKVYKINATAAIQANKIGCNECLVHLKKEVRRHKQKVKVKMVRNGRSIKFVITSTTDKFTKSGLRSILQSFINYKHLSKNIIIKSTGKSSYQLWFVREVASLAVTKQYVLNFSQVKHM